MQYVVIEDNEWHGYAFFSYLKSYQTQSNDAFDVMPIKVLHFPLCLFQCTPAEFVTISKSLVKLMKHLQSNKEVVTSKLESPLLRNLFTEVRQNDDW